MAQLPTFASRGSRYVPSGARAPGFREREGGGWPSGVEDLAQDGGEVVRLAHAAELGADEPVVAAREGDGCRPKAFGHGYGGAASDHLGRFRSDAEDDAARCRAQRAEIVLVAGGVDHVQAEKRVVTG